MWQNGEFALLISEDQNSEYQYSQTKVEQENASAIYNKKAQAFLKLACVTEWYWLLLLSE